MAGLVWYPDEPAIPAVDHMHERSHQHQTFWRTLAHKRPDQILIPNQPDVDIRDNITHYLVEIEVPGVKDVNNIKCQWISNTALIVSGQVNRPDEAKPANQSEENLTVSAQETPPYLVIGERRIGSFRRHLTFPGTIEHEKMIAKLEAGVLRLLIPKQSLHRPKGDGLVKIEVDDDFPELVRGGSHTTEDEMFPVNRGSW